MTALRRLFRLLRAEPEPRPPYMPRHSRTVPPQSLAPGDPR